AIVQPAIFRLIEQHADPNSLFFIVKTATSTDVGSWISKRKIWACCLAEELLLIAGGQKPFIEKTAFRQLTDSMYNHVTANLMLAPAEQLTVKRLKMSPHDAAQVLAQIHA
ncbi:MAG: hypothetical protein JXN60_04995, partial [Lentisphaerae bacterium]|nr:hypothetical protein [Lentisphaerota bacterium]